MTITVHIATVAASISALSISGVTVKDIDEIPDNAVLQPGTLYPNTEHWIDNLSVTVKTRGTGGGERLDIGYDMSYRYLHSAPGAVGGMSYYSGLITAVMAIMVSLTTNDTVSGLVDMRLKSISRPGGMVTDPAGNQYHGCDFVISVLEYGEL